MDDDSIKNAVERDFLNMKRFLQGSTSQRTLSSRAKVPVALTLAAMLGTTIPAFAGEPGGEPITAKGAISDSLYNAYVEAGFDPDEAYRTIVEHKGSDPETRMRNILAQRIYEAEHDDTNLSEKALVHIEYGADGTMAVLPETPSVKDSLKEASPDTGGPDPEPEGSDGSSGKIYRSEGPRYDFSNATVKYVSTNDSDLERTVEAETANERGIWGKLRDGARLIWNYGNRNVGKDSAPTRDEAETSEEEEYVGQATGEEKPNSQEITDPCAADLSREVGKVVKIWDRVWNNATGVPIVDPSLTVTRTFPYETMVGQEFTRPLELKADEGVSLAYFTSNTNVEGLVCEDPYMLLRVWENGKRTGEIIRAEGDSNNIFFPGLLDLGDLSGTYEIFTDCVDDEGETHTKAWTQGFLDYNAAPDTTFVTADPETVTVTKTRYVSEPSADDDGRPLVTATAGFDYESTTQGPTTMTQPTASLSIDGYFDTPMGTQTDVGIRYATTKGKGGEFKAGGEEIGQYPLYSIDGKVLVKKSLGDNWVLGAGVNAGYTETVIDFDAEFIDNMGDYTTIVEPNGLLRIQSEGFQDPFDVSSPGFNRAAIARYGRQFAMKPGDEGDSTTDIFGGNLIIQKGPVEVDLFGEYFYTQTKSETHEMDGVHIGGDLSLLLGPDYKLVVGGGIITDIDEDFNPAEFDGYNVSVQLVRGF